MTAPERARREHAILKLLKDALWEIQMELLANDHDEIARNPMLKGKSDFVARAQKRIAKWETR